MSAFAGTPRFEAPLTDPLDKHGKMATSFLPVVTGKTVLWLGLGVFGIFYLAFQKKVLPLRVAKVAAKVFFWPTLPITILNRLGNYWTTLDDTLIVGAAPVAALGHVEALRELGVTGVVNLCDEYCGPVNLYKKHGIDQLYLPTVDHFEPSLADIKKAVAFIQDRKKRGEKAFVHCKAGHGRSAAIALCWLLTQNPGVPTHELNQRMRAKRKVRKTLYLQSSVKAFAKEWAAKHPGVN